MVQHVRLETRPDRLGWVEDVSDCFSVASARRWLDRITLFRGGDVTTWNNWVPIKLCVLLWRIRLSGIPTRERRLTIFLQGALNCGRCGVVLLFGGGWIPLLGIRFGPSWSGRLSWRSGLVSGRLLMQLLSPRFGCCGTSEIIPFLGCLPLKRLLFLMMW